MLTEIDREFFKDQGIQLAPGPKELMNMQRFYLYLNMTKPRELLCLSFCQSDSQGKALSPAFLVSNIREMFPKMEIRQCGDMQEPMELLELPGISLDYFLRGLAGEAYQDNAVFQELYSWYLQSPEYRILVKNLQRHLFQNDRQTRSEKQWQRSSMEKFLRTALPGWSVLRPVHLHIFCSMA